VPVEDDTLAKPFELNPSKTFLDPRDAAETTSLGLLAGPLRPAPEESGAAATGGCEERRAAERSGETGQDEARTKLSMALPREET